MNTSRLSAYEIKEAIRGIESDITEREKRMIRRERSLDRAGDRINDAIAAEDHAAQAKAEAKAKEIRATMADEAIVLDACRENLVRHRAVLEEVEAEARAAYLKRAEERQAEVEAFVERMITHYQAGTMVDRFGPITPDIQNLDIVSRGTGYLEVGFQVEKIIGAGKEYERREVNRFYTTVNLPEPKEMQSWIHAQTTAEINWPAFGTQDQDITRCFGQVLRVAACIGEWADSVLAD